MPNAKKKKTELLDGRGAPKGSKNNAKFPKLKKLGLLDEAFQSLLDHLEEGLMKDSWHFDHPQMKLTWQTMEKYLRDYPEDLPNDRVEHAKSVGQQKWERKVDGAAFQPSKDHSPAVIQMIMRNKFNWDRDLGENKKSPQTFDHQLKILKQVDGEWKELT